MQTSKKIDVNILKFEIMWFYHSEIVQEMQMEWQTVQTQTKTRLLPLEQSDLGEKVKTLSDTRELSDLGLYCFPSGSNSEDPDQTFLSKCAMLWDYGTFCPP